MPFTVEGLTSDDFITSGWRDAVENAAERDCLHYRSTFYAEAERARADGEEKRANVFSLLGDLSSMFIDADDSTDPLKPMWQMEGRRSAIPSDFDSALTFLSEVLPHIDDAELKARIGDVLWLRKRDFKAAREAVTAYLTCAHLKNDESWPDATSRIERAIAIAVQTRQHDLLDEVTHRLVEGLDTFQGDEASFLPARLMQILQNRKEGDAVKYAALAKRLAVAAEGRGDWHQAREYWDRQADWYKISKDEEKEKSARLQSAETYVQEANSRLNAPQGERYMVAVGFLERAIQALRAIGGQGEQIAELHRRLLQYQQQAVAELKSFSHEIDVSAMVASATEAVTGKNLRDALFALALLGSPPLIANLRKQAVAQRQSSIFSFMPMRLTNAMGRTVAKQDPPEAGESEDEANLRKEMYKLANFSHALYVQGAILPALSQLLQEHPAIREHDLRELVSDNPFVPRGREEFYIRGLQAGYRGDWAGATHLLVPQIENSVRFVLEQRSVITSGLDDDGIQDERDLNRTLRLPDFTQPLIESMGEDMVFDLRGLLIERYGANLRNDMAHGLLDYDAFHSAPCVYLWWLTLRLLCLPTIITERAQKQQQEKGGEASEDASHPIGEIEDKA